MKNTLEILASLRYHFITNRTHHILFFWHHFCAKSTLSFGSLHPLRIHREPTFTPIDDCERQVLEDRHRVYCDARCKLVKG